MAIAFALMLALAAFLSDGPTSADVVSGGVIFGVMIGAAVGVTRVLTSASQAGPTAHIDPRRVIADDFVFWLVCGAAPGLAVMAVVLLFVVLQGTPAPEVLVVAGLLSLPVGLLVLALRLPRSGVWTGYLAMLLCTRRGPTVLPWRFERHLHWAEQTGLLRLAGHAYQFRHRELQDWLADPANRP
ncbi:hypothetical protein OG216_45260 [Streptomycetaceae bacterium NBC_01309]